MITKARLKLSRESIQSCHSISSSGTSEAVSGPQRTWIASSSLLHPCHYSIYVLILCQLHSMSGVVLGKLSLIPGISNILGSPL